MLFAASVQLLVCAASLSSPPASTSGVESVPAATFSAGATTSPPVTALPTAVQQSAFIENVDDIPLRPLQLPSTGENRPATKKPAPAEGKVRRTVSEWLTRGNRSEPAPNFFARIRKEQKSASDSLLVSRCRSMLLADPTLRNFFVHVSANEGVITLKGNVPTELIKINAEQLARKTPASVDVRNELTVGTGTPIQQTSFVGASLSMPLRLDGSGLQSPSPSAVSLGSAVAAPSPVSSSPATSAAVTLGAPIQIASASPELPVVRSFDVSRPAGPVLSSSAMPPIRHSTMEQLQVAKAPVEATVLPSGHRVDDASGRRAPIPAPPSQSGPYSTSVPVTKAAPKPVAVTPTSRDAKEQQLSNDVAALLSKDPRGRGLIFVVRGSEVRLSGTVRTSEEIYAISQLLDEIPGIDFVSFDDVQFTN